MGDLAVCKLWFWRQEFMDDYLSPMQCALLTYMNRGGNCRWKSFREIESSSWVRKQ